MNRRSLLTAGAFTITGAVLGVGKTWAAQGPSIPTVLVRGALAPDFSRITFGSLPPISQAGSIAVPRHLAYQIGYDPSRSWQAGASADSYSLLGDFQGSFDLQRFTLQQISKLAGSSLNGLKLSDFGLLPSQTIGDLVQAIPSLGQLETAAVKPIYDLINQSGLRQALSAGRGAIGSAGTIAEAISNPSIKNLALAGQELGGNLGLENLPNELKGVFDLSKYGIDSIPGLLKTPLNQFKAWGQSYINQIPGLRDVPFSNFLDIGSLSDGVVGTTDVVYGKKEANRLNTVTGSDVEGFQVPCRQQSCQYLELSGIPHGKQWISGNSQQVRGGHGPLAALNGGKEPTGRLPYGPAFKVVMLDSKESKGTAEFGLYFRITADIPFVGFTASPYFIGPIPWLAAKEKSPIFLGSNVAASLAPAAASLAASQAGNVNPSKVQGVPGTAPLFDKTASAKTSPDNQSFKSSSSKTSSVATGKFTSPVPLNKARESSSFGNRYHPIDHREKFHAGVDLAVPIGTAVKAADGGIVSFVGTRGGYGNFIEIDHGNGTKTRYGHLSQLNVRAGQAVQQGQGIALSGSTGHSTGPHLHFEIRKNNQPVDPANYVRGIN